MSEPTASIDTSISTRLMQSTANVFVVLVVCACVVAVFWRVMHLPLFSFSRLQVVGECLVIGPVLLPFGFDFVMEVLHYFSFQSQFSVSVFSLNLNN